MTPNRQVHQAVRALRISLVPEFAIPGVMSVSSYHHITTITATTVTATTATANKTDNGNARVVVISCPIPKPRNLTTSRPHSTTPIEAPHAFLKEVNAEA
jgi:hypothetical protein